MSEFNVADMAMAAEAFMATGSGLVLSLVLILGAMAVDFLLVSGDERNPEK